MMKQMTAAADGGATCLLVDDLSPEDTAMFQALYARSAAGAEKILAELYRARRERVLTSLQTHFQHALGGSWVPDLALDDIIATAHDETSARAKRLHENYAVNYGHKSIADCGSTTLCCEGVSMLVAKAVQDWALYSGQETSTRAIDMTKQRLIDPIGTSKSEAALRRWIDFYATSQQPVAQEVRLRYPKQAGEDEKLYEGAVRYRTFDILRSILPAAATTNVSWHTNLRQAGDHLVGLLLHPLAEVRAVARVWQQLLQKRYPSSGSFGEEAAVSGVGRDGHGAERAVWNATSARQFTYPDLGSTAIAAEWRFRDGLQIPVNTELDQAFRTRPKGCVLPHWMTRFGQLQFDFKMDFGSFRDLQRHRNGVCMMPVLTMRHGFERWYLEQLPSGLHAQATELIAEQQRDIDQLQFASTWAASVMTQYYVAMGFRVPCSVTYALPAFVYMTELRSGKAIHPTLRSVVHRMIANFREGHADIPLHADMEPDSWTVRRGGHTIEKRS